MERRNNTRQWRSTVGSHQVKDMTLSFAQGHCGDSVVHSVGGRDDKKKERKSVREREGERER